MPKDLKFRELLTSAFYHAKAKRNRYIGPMEREIGDALGFSQAAVQRWRKGYFPEARVFIFLVRHFAKDMDKNWADELLDVAVRHGRMSKDEKQKVLEGLFKPTPPQASEPPDNKTQNKLDHVGKKLIHLQGMGDYPLALVCSIYLDQIVGPIRTKELRPQEWVNVTFKFDLGGSGIWVGRFLKQWYNKTSHLFSVRGRGDHGFTSLFNRRFQRETVQKTDSKQHEEENGSERRWIHDHTIPAGDKDSHTAVTLHLLQADREFTTMLTEKGILDLFVWDIVEDELSKLLNNGGVLYLSGYLKTRLGEKLVDHLQLYNESNTLVCIDHGRLVRGDVDPNTVNQLHDAFVLGSIDIYFCTLDELWDFCHIQDDQPLPILANTGEVREILVELSKQITLPIITVVRDNNLISDVKAFALMGRRVVPIEGEAGRGLIGDYIGPKNAFNAAFIHYLLTKTRLDDQSKDAARWQIIERAVQQAGQHALEKWRGAPLEIGLFKPY